MTNDTATSKNKFKISFVLPVFNTEDYVAETIESVIAQDIGFEENCELVIVDDGSTDSSGEICREYADRYPNNILYIKKKSNGGVSSALNLGVSKSSGEFIGFIGSDDLISSDTGRLVWEFMDVNRSKIDIASIGIELFGNMSGPHPLNYRFTETRIVNIDLEPDSIQLAGGGVFIKNEVANDFQHDESLKMYEDADMISRVVLERMAYGIIVGPTYFYRKRGGSLVNDKAASSSWFIETPRDFYLPIFDYARSKFGYVPKYIQHVIAYDIQWQTRLRERPPITDKQMEYYKSVIRKLLLEIDDEVVISQKYLHREHVIHLLSLKYGRDINKELTIDDSGRVYHNQRRLYEMSNQVVRIESISVDGGRIRIAGWYGGILDDLATISVAFCGKEYRLKKSYRPNSDIFVMGERIYLHSAFTVDLDSSENMGVIEFHATYNGGASTMRTTLSKFSYLGNSPRSFRLVGGLLITRTLLGLLVEKSSKFLLLKKEVIFSLKMLKNLRFAIVFYRLASYIFRVFYRSKSVWLISDRPHSAGDNGEYLFRYAASVKDSSILPIFAINKESDSYKKLKKIGRVVPYFSIRYKILFLIADLRTSSMFDEYIIDDFGKDSEYIRDLYKFKFVYINHGVLTSDSSAVFGKFSKNAKLLTVGSEFEKNSILNNKDYGYTKDQVVVAGIPRFDPIKRNVKKKNREIVFMPTWRSKLAGSVEVGRSGRTYAKRTYEESFKASEYFDFYNRLINDQRLIAALEKHNYRINFCIHPSLSDNWMDFEGSSRVKICQPPHNYVDLMNRADLMVTDYSGVAFDFAYAKKPVIYTQFDKDNLYDSHYYKKGDFNFEKHGFGDVTTGYEESVSAIINTLESECEMPNKYKKRVDNFFYKIDSNNSKRVYDSIKNKFNRG